MARPPGRDAGAPGGAAEIAWASSPVVREAAPAVVNIYAKPRGGGAQPVRDDPFFRDLFRDFGTAAPRVQNSLGSA